jgi:hypothetical protein
VVDLQPRDRLPADLRGCARSRTRLPGRRLVFGSHRTLALEDSSDNKTIRTRDLYIHPLYVLVSKILSSILNSPVPIHPLYHPLFTISTMGPTYHFI